MPRAVRRPLAGQVVLVTGAARGIGAELAREVVARGGRVVLTGLEPELLARLADELGPRALWVEADVTDHDALTAAVEAAVERFGGLDAVVANAGLAPVGTVATSPAAALARTVEVNLTGAVLTAHAALPALVRRRGHVLLVSSAAAFVALPGMSVYCASKVGLERFGDVLRLEVAHRGVTVASAHPTWIDTDMVRDAEAALPGFAASRARLPGPLGALTPVRDCARALADNLETRGRRVFVPGSVRGLAALRGLATGALAERLLLRVAATRVPSLERDVAALGGRAFGAHSVGGAAGHRDGRLP